MVSATMAEEAELRVESREELFSWDGYLTDSEHLHWDVTPDGQRFVAIRPPPNSEARFSPFAVVGKFDQEVNRLVPVD